jgi:NAD(P)-dependent dehydrogenase (short-subunit alcohol dehydrogenase family)
VLTGAGLDARLLVLDVLDQASVDAAAASVLEEFGRIDVVVANAGVGSDGTLEELPIEEIAACMDTNFYGALRTVKAFLPAMREAGHGRVIGLSSIAGVFGQPFNDAYCASKFALEAVFESMHPVITRFGVYPSLIEPGPVADEFVSKSAATPPRSNSGPYAALRSGFMAAQSGAFATAQPCEEIAEAIWQIANAEKPSLRYQPNVFSSKLSSKKLADLSGDRITSITGRWLD